jgi:predicted nucleic acid-binding protein
LSDLVDTNVVSETMRRSPEVKAVAWLNSQAWETLDLSAISLAELMLGIAVLPNGRRKTGLGLALGERALDQSLERE